MKAIGLYLVLVLLTLHRAKSDDESWNDLVKQAQERVGIDLLERTILGQTSTRNSRRGAAFV